MDYQKKYLKYKLKYLQLKKLKGGGENENLSFFLDFNKVSESLIKKYEIFLNKENINSPVNFIAKGNNGIVNNFNFKNSSDDKNFDLIVKTSIAVGADNLYYEYVAGKCVNKFKKYFPNFCFTFNYGFINDPEGSLIGALKNEGGISDLSELKAKLRINPLTEPLVTPDNFKFSCENNSNVCLMIENIPNSIKIKDLIKDPEFLANLDYNLFCCLFQLYVALFSLSELFTHYDLNLFNVMYTKLDKPIKIIYDVKQFGKSITLYTKFIPVIIDYARSHVKCPDLLIESNNIAEVVCNVKECNSKELPLCDTVNAGMFFGIRNFRNYLGLYQDVDNFENFHHINPRKLNRSHDLLHLHFWMYYQFQISSGTEDSKLKCPLRDSYETVFENRDWTKLGKEGIIYGNKEFPHSYDLTPKKIKTTQDVVRWLIDYFEGNFKDYKIEDTFANICIKTDLSEPFDFLLN